MGSIMVVNLYPLLSDVPDLLQSAKQVKIEDIFTVGTIEAFNIGVLIRPLRSNKVEPDMMQLSPTR